MTLNELMKALSVEKMAADIHAGLDLCAGLIEKTAKEEIGHYQAESGPFPSWAPLADSTVREKERLGYTGRLSADDPLLRTGEMRDSIEHRTGDMEAFIGTDSPIAPYHEFGTDKMPPRPFIGPALVKNKENIEKIIGGFAASAMVPALAGEEWKRDIEEVMTDGRL